jgi:hypothetical protein
VIAVIIASALTTTAKAIAIPVAIAAFTAAATLLLSRASEAANRRRDHYADAVATLVAWTEFPYRVRRRTDDLPETLSALAARGHDLQERLACHQAWIVTESTRAAAAYKQARTTVGPLVGGAVQDAWTCAPASTPAAMNLGDWGPGRDCQPEIDRLLTSISTRFGWRRVRQLLRRP